MQSKNIYNFTLTNACINIIPLDFMALHLRRIILFVCVCLPIDNALAESTDALDGLERIDEKADKLGIAMVKINDLELVDEYGLQGIPSLVYYRHAAPILFEGREQGSQRIEVMKHT